MLLGQVENSHVGCRTEGGERFSGVSDVRQRKGIAALIQYVSRTSNEATIRNLDTNGDVAWIKFAAALPSGSISTHVIEHDKAPTA
jgi:hypothetical protein